jgi:organic hydroperoxide reductase OsmC/OhrA
MGESYQHQVVAWWSSGRTGMAKSNSAPNTIHFAAPPQFGGLEGRWSPEDLLLSAVAGCFTTTFRVLAEYSKWEYLDLQVEALGSVEKVDSGYSFTRIVVRPLLKILGEPERERGLHLLHKANNLCLVSRALAVAQAFEPVVEVAKSATSAEKLSAIVADLSDGKQAKQ